VPPGINTIPFSEVSPLKSMLLSVDAAVKRCGIAMQECAESCFEFSTACGAFLQALKLQIAAKTIHPAIIALPFSFIVIVVKLSQGIAANTTVCFSLKCLNVSGTLGKNHGA